MKLFVTAVVLVMACATEPELAATEQHDDNACFPPMDLGCTQVIGQKWHCTKCWVAETGVPGCGEYCRNVLTLELVPCSTHKQITKMPWDWRVEHVVTQDAAHRTHVWSLAEGMIESKTDTLPLDPITAIYRRAGDLSGALDMLADGKVLLAEGGDPTARVLASPNGAPFLRAADLDGDGADELLYRAGDGSVAVRWPATGATAAIATVLDASWTLAGAGDLDGDHRDDLVWRKGGELRTWRMDGARVAATTSQAAASAWAVAAVADFDADARADILWRDSASTARIWRSGSAQQATASFALSPAYTVEGAQDVDGDGRADLILAAATATGVGYTALATPLDGAVVHGPDLRVITP